MSQSEPEYPFSTAQNWAIALVCIVGAFMIVLPGQLDWHGTAASVLVAAGVLVEILLLVAVLTVAFGSGFTIPGFPRRGSGESFRPLSFLAFVVFVVVSVYVAIKGAS